MHGGNTLDKGDSPNRTNFSVDIGERSLDLITHTPEGYLVGKKRVEVTNPSKPERVNFTTEDPEEYKPRDVTRMGVEGIAEQMAREGVSLDRYNGFVVWFLETSNYARALLVNDDWVGGKDKFVMEVQFFTYRPFESS